MGLRSGAIAARDGSVGLVLALILISTLRLHSYLLFHGFAELFSVVIAATYAVIALHARRAADGSSIVPLGLAYFYVAVLDAVHTLAFPGMGVFVDHQFSANQVWIVARVLEASALCLFNNIDMRRPRHALLFFIAFTSVTVGGLASIYVFRSFPVCFVEGQGQTGFKIGAELFIMFLLVLASALLRRRKGSYPTPIYRLLQLSILATLVSEASFAVYVSNFDGLNMAGHLLKIVSFFLVYRAVVVTCLERPEELLYNELQATAEALRRTNEAKDKFISILSHDLRGPLSGIRSFAALSADADDGPGSVPARTAFAEISKAADLSLRLVERVLDWAKAMSGTAEPNLLPVELSDAVSAEFESLAEAANRKGVSFRVAGCSPQEGRPTALADGGMLATIIRNLVQNAVKFTPSGGSVTVSYGVSGNTARLEVADTGVGMAPEVIDRLFDPSFKSTTPGTDGERGSGFGLVLCAEFARKMNGTLTAESEQGRGSLFRLTLPQALI
jgi:signal transduction histidine kinase